MGHVFNPLTLPSLAGQALKGGTNKNVSYEKSERENGNDHYLCIVLCNRTCTRW
jgi:hypothetical protein